MTVVLAQPGFNHIGVAADHPDYPQSLAAGEPDPACLDKAISMANTSTSGSHRDIHMISKADIFIIAAVVIAFSLGVYLFFYGERDQGIFVATWVPAILGFGIYFKLMRGNR